jgi:hypothetical protein
VIDVDTVRVVQVAPVFFYEYLRQPCVQLAFCEGGKKVFAGWNQYYINMCAPPKMSVAAPACSRDTTACEYNGERVTFGSATERYAALSAAAFQCNPANHYDCGRDGFSDNNRLDNNEWQWTSASCTIQVDGRFWR